MAGLRPSQSEQKLIQKFFGLTMDVDRTREKGGSNPQDGQERFVPTCPICGDKHWPHHPLAPCFNAKKVKERTKAEAAARVLAEKQAAD